MLPSLLLENTPTKEDILWHSLLTYSHNEQSLTKTEISIKAITTYSLQNKMMKQSHEKLKTLQLQKVQNLNAPTTVKFPVLGIIYNHSWTKCKVH